MDPVEIEPTRLRVSEIFGPTLQGEGNSQGRPVMFLRLGLCNLDCSWCDTPYTWDWTGKNGKVYDKDKELMWLSVNEITEWASDIRSNNNVTRMVITGGEPLIQQKRLAVLVEALAGHGITVEIETNGTISPNETLRHHARFNVSPKLSSSGVAADKALDLEVLTEFVNLDRASFKFVIADDTDLADMRTLIERLGVEPNRVFVMPEGITREAILSRLPWLFDKAATNGWNLSPRLHVLAFDNKRGV